MALENENFTNGNSPETETISGARGANSYSNIHYFFLFKSPLFFKFK